MDRRRSIHSGVPDPPLVYTVVAGQREGTTILTLIGPLTLYNLFAFQDELRKVTASDIILDMEQTTYMDSAGLGLLMNGYVSATRHGRRFMLAGVNLRVGALLSLTKVDEVLTILPSVEAAEAALMRQS